MEPLSKLQDDEGSASSSTDTKLGEVGGGKGGRKIRSYLLESFTSTSASEKKDENSEGSIE